MSFYESLADHGFDSFSATPRSMRFDALLSSKSVLFEFSVHCFLLLCVVRKLTLKRKCDCSSIVQCPIIKIISTVDRWFRIRKGIRRNNVCLCKEKYTISDDCFLYSFFINCCLFKLNFIAEVSHILLFAFGNSSIFNIHCHYQFWFKIKRIALRMLEQNCFVCKKCHSIFF